MAKAIFLLADGTGNSRSARFRTNVWKLYSALELSPGGGQIALYHDGVGTSQFAPLKILGGVFGAGVGRNIQDLYAFLCRNYEEGDTIYLFGFSRGAFTARVLAGLIARIGVRVYDDEIELRRWVRTAFHSYRALGPQTLLSRVVGMLRPGIRQVRRDFTAKRHRPDIAFLGVWDTVSAYGGPIAEMVRGWDKWVWPLSFSNYKLHPKVRIGRHALALDEEREAFLPILWDEIRSRRPERIRQVWFAGVHSDVGGGYPDEGLSAVPLVWMLGEAEAVGAQFTPGGKAKALAAASPVAPIHDSRSGIGLLYRYEPRRFEALAGPPSRSTLRDPASGGGRLAKLPLVHTSVIQRIEEGTDGYAPIVLPDTFVVDGSPEHLPPILQSSLWAKVRWRRRLQFAVLSVVGFGLICPLLPTNGTIDVIDDAWAPIVRWALSAVPGLPQWAVDAYGSSALWLLVASFVAASVVAASNRMRLTILNCSRTIWKQFRKPALAPAVMGTPHTIRAKIEHALLLIRWQRQRFFRWTLMPAVFGILYYAATLAFFLPIANKLSILVREWNGDLCTMKAVPSYRFETDDPCQRVGPSQPLSKSRDYIVRLIMPPDGTWRDGGRAPATPEEPSSGTSTTPQGFTYVESVRQHLKMGLVSAADAIFAHLISVPARRVIFARWFTPILAIRPNDGHFVRNIPLDLREMADGSYVARITPPLSGYSYLFVNDATMPIFDGATRRFYQRDQGVGPNWGYACVEIRPTGAAFKSPATCPSRVVPSAH